MIIFQKIGIKVIKRTFLIASLLINVHVLWSQGPVDGFFNKKNKIDLAISAGYAISPKYFAGTKLISYPRNQSILSVYGKIGLSERWNLIINLPIINFKPQDVGIYGKFKILQRKKGNGNFSLGTAVGIALPSWNYPTESGQAIGQRAVIIQPFLFGQYKNDNGFFIQLQSHYNYALSPVPSSIDASLKIGFAGAKWYSDVWYNTQYGFGDKDYQGNVSFNSFRELTTSFDRVGGVIYYSISNKIGVFINGSYVLSGRNISKSLNLGGGVVFKINTKK